MGNLKQLVEQCGGAVVYQEEIDICLPHAIRKLKLIIGREGDGNGERLKPYYLAQILWEIISLERFSRSIKIARSERQSKACKNEKT